MQHKNESQYNNLEYFSHRPTAEVLKVLTRGHSIDETVQKSIHNSYGRFVSHSVWGGGQSLSVAPPAIMDSDGDGVGDDTDAFPEDATETMDSDGDDVGDNTDAFPNDPLETMDSDGDGVGDNADAFPSDPSKTKVTDSGTGGGGGGTPPDSGDPTITEAFKAAETAVAALEPHHMATQAQVEAAEMAIVQVTTLATMLEQAEMLRYINLAEFLGQSVRDAREFVDADVGTAAMAETDAMTAQQNVDTTDEDGVVGAFENDKYGALIVAMGVSEGIADEATSSAPTSAIPKIQTGIEEIERELRLAERAKMNLEAEAATLRREKARLEMEIATILDGATKQAFQDMVTILEQAARDAESAIAAVDYYVDAKEDAAQVADELAALLETGGPECGWQCPGPGNPPNLDGVQEGNLYRPGAKETRQEAADLRKDASDYKAQLITFEGVEYTYDDLNENVAEPRRDAANEKKDDLAAIVEHQDNLPTEADIENKETDAAEAQGHIDAINGILDPLKADLLRWQGVVGDGVAAAESEKAELVLNMLEDTLKEVIEDSVLGVDLKTNYTPNRDHDQVIEAAELDDNDNHVFARATAPAGTMTFKQIANGNNAWVLHRRSFTTSGTTVDTAAHRPVDYRAGSNMGGTGLPQNHLAISLTGLNASDFVKQEGTSPADGERLASQLFHHGKLNGIEGTLYCDRAGGCRATTLQSNVVFAEGWYFTPVVNSNRYSSLGYNTELARYTDSDGDGVYELVSYVDYGMWLEEVDDALLLLRRANLVGPSASPSALDFTTVGNATYNGEARGLSARTVGTGDDAVTASGHFLADVELNATFKASPELAGTINNFRPVLGQSNGHVDSTWSLMLGGVPDGNNEFEGRFSQGGVGEWSATPYGASGERPDGFYGGFNAVFSDNEGINGAAAGVYSAEKE